MAIGGIPPLLHAKNPEASHQNDDEPEADDEHGDDEVGCGLQVWSHTPSLVGGLEHFLFSHVLGMIIPTDSYFQRGRVQPPTSSEAFRRPQPQESDDEDMPPLVP